jgi:hypothetical protein
MTTRAHGPGAGLGWLKRGINLGRHNPRAIFGGAVLLALVAMLPSLLQLLLQPLVGTGAAATGALLFLITLLSLLLMPPVIGGYLRVIDASEHGRPATAGEVLAPFRSMPDLRRLIGFGLVMTALYLLVAAALVYLLSPGFPAWYMQIAMLSQAGPAVDATALPAPPDGIGALLALGRWWACSSAACMRSASARSRSPATGSAARWPTASPAPCATCCRCWCWRWSGWCWVWWCC